MSSIDVPVGHGQLEAVFWKVEDARAAAVVCHPHPLYGGTMHNHVTYRIGQAFRHHQIAGLQQLIVQIHVCPTERPPLLIGHRFPERS